MKVLSIYYFSQDATHVLLKIYGSDKEYIQLSMRKFSLKEHESVSHNKAVKKTKTWEKFLTTDGLQTLLETIFKASSFRWIFVCLKGSIKHHLTYFWCLNKGPHSLTLILIFDWNPFLKFRIFQHLEKLGMRCSYLIFF